MGFFNAWTIGSLLISLAVAYHAIRNGKSPMWLVGLALGSFLYPPLGTIAIWFGYLASRLVGVGNTWLLVVVGAGLANWIEAYFGPSKHLSVGASTAVFTALGLLSAYSWRTRLAYPQRWALRWGPLIAGVILLSWTGTGGESLDQPGVGGGGQSVDVSVDVLAHALGFAVGLCTGAGVALGAAPGVLDRVPQWFAGLLALVPLVLAWIRALSS